MWKLCLNQLHSANVDNFVLAMFLLLFSLLIIQGLVGLHDEFDPLTSLYVGSMNAWWFDCELSRVTPNSSSLIFISQYNNDNSPVNVSVSLIRGIVHQKN
ncbi:hypothetical protein GJ496_007311 [Pomphorhynchus laevis]|nr:hypothetical protein GJ496_007311 [Pomphorhynchus laevis]